LNVSNKVMVMIDDAIPSAKTGSVPDMVLLAAIGAPPIKIEVPPLIENGVTRLKFLISAFDDFKVHVEIPEVLLKLHGP
jgi:hypothetical protein